MTRKKQGKNENDGKFEKPPLAESEIRKNFNREGTKKVPKELKKMLVPELEPYKLKEIKRETAEEVAPEDMKPMMPDWFDVKSRPCKARIPHTLGIRQRGKELRPLTVFGADDRRRYNDTSYPWGTICRIATSAGSGSGVIVGPRHVLTASHVVDWSRNGAGTVEVHRNGGGVRASTAISRVWYYTRITGNTISWTEQDEDYAVLVTSERIGDLFGWLGTRTYNSSWDDEPYWWNIGYPGSISNGLSPTFQRNVALDEPWNDFGPARSMSTRSDLTPGNSGGPMFGFWDNGPYVVAVASSESDDDNWCSGGSWLTNLVSHARSSDA